MKFFGLVFGILLSVSTVQVMAMEASEITEKYYFKNLSELPGKSCHALWEAISSLNRTKFRLANEVENTIIRQAIEKRQSIIESGAAQSLEPLDILLDRRSELHRQIRNPNLNQRDLVRIGKEFGEIHAAIEALKILHDRRRLDIREYYSCEFLIRSYYEELGGGDPDRLKSCSKIMEKRFQNYRREYLECLIGQDSK